LKLYWVMFLEPGSCAGVTAVDEADCLELVLNSSIFSARSVASVTEIRNFEEIDQNHVVPNMGNIFIRGFWFPNGI
jgi:hypothetical protein